MARTEIRLAGSGGQGLLTAGRLLAETAMREGLRVVQFQAYGPEARLGSSYSDVIISDREIRYPKCKRPDVLLVMNQDSYDKFIHTVKEGGLVVADTTFVVPREDKRVRLLSRDFTRICRVELGTPLPANVMLLGFFLRVWGRLPLRGMEEVIKKRIKPQFVELNTRALRLGYEMAEDGADFRSD